MELIRNTSDHIIAFERLLKAIFKTEDTSILHKVVKGLHAVNAMVEKEISEGLFQMFGSEMERYVNEMHPTIEYTVNTFQSSAREANLLLDYYKSAPFSIQFFDVLREFNQSLTRITRVLPMVVRKLGGKRRLENKHLPNAISIAGRLRYRQCYYEHSMSSLEAMIETVLAVVNSRDYMENNTKWKTIEDFSKHAKIQSECLSVYFDFIEGVSNWLNDPSVASFDREMSLRGEINWLEKYQAKLDGFAEDFLLERKTLLEIATDLTINSNDVMEMIADTVGHVHKMLSPLLTYLNIHEERLSNRLLDAFLIMDDWQYFVPSNRNITNWTRKSAIWKKPMVDLNNPKVSYTELLIGY